MTDAALARDMCVCFGVRHAARILTRAYDEALRPAGLKATQFSILTALSLAGTVSITALADLMGHDRSTMSRNLRPLERDGLVTLSPEGARRVRMVGITAAGRKRYETAFPLWTQAQAQALSRMGAKGWPRLKADLATLESAM